MSTIVALIGRPNVGKSTLFNRMVGKGGAYPRSPAITEKTPGVTRDRNYGDAEWKGRHFTVVDTGGFFGAQSPSADDEIVRLVEEQALYAVQESDVVIHVLDGKTGLTPGDSEVARLLRESGKKVLWVVNKVDSDRNDDRIFEFYRIGAETLIPVSALTGYGFDEFMDAVMSRLPHREDAEESADKRSHIPKVAVIGRPNVGKSTLINTLLNKKRLIVTSRPGTTRDAVDSLCSYYGRKYLFIDTAGIRKKVESYSVEGFSVIRTITSIKRADVIIIVLDASTGLVEQDQKIAGMVEESGKGVLFLLNKWDLVRDPEREYKRLLQEMKARIWFLHYVPCITTSALMRKRTTNVFPVIDRIIAERKKRIPTAELNRLLGRLTLSKPFPPYRGKELKFYYMTQVGVEPPQFTIFVNSPSAFKEQQTRYFEKAVRKEYSFKGTPIKIYYKSR